MTQNFRVLFASCLLVSVSAFAAHADRDGLGPRANKAYPLDTADAKSGGSPATLGGDELEFDELSSKHVLYGVSQLIALRLSDESYPVKLINPQGFPMVAVLLVYESPRDPDDEPAEVPGDFTGCLIRTLAPHGAEGIADGDFEAVFTLVNDSVGEADRPDGGGIQEWPYYAEIISVPLQEVEIDDGIVIGDAKPGGDALGGDDDDDDRGRVGDGLGITVDGTQGPTVHLLNPKLFSLPSDAIVAGQRQEAIDCVLAALADAGLPADLFEEFGIE